MQRAIVVTLMTLSLLSPTLGGPASHVKAQQGDHLPAIQRLYDEVWNGGDLELIDDLFAADHVYHDPSTPGIGGGPTGYRQLVELYSGAFPDIHLTVGDVVAEGDTVAVRWSATGTQTGEFMGIPASGRTASVSALTFLTIEDGRFAENWSVFDAVGLLTQLGAFPPPAAATPEA